MKHNLQKRILVPFILFSVILTTLVVSWSALFIANFFKEHEYSSRKNELKHLQLQLDKHLSLISTIQTKARSGKDAKRLLRAYSPTSVPLEHISITSTKRNTPSPSPDTLILPSLRASTPFVITLAFDQFLADKKSSNAHLGIIIQNQTSSTTSLSSNAPLTPEAKSKIFSSFHSLQSSKIEPSPTTLFIKSTAHNSVYYFISVTAFSYYTTLLKIIMGLIAAIGLSTAVLFTMYLLIIKKMTTSIDILRSVSKKVAKGNFNEKVYIYSQDEIGELATAFNQMVGKLKESTSTIIKQKEQSDAIIDCIPDGLIVTTFKNKLMIANKKAEDLFEFKTESNLAKNIETCIRHTSFKEHSKQLKTNSTYTSEFSYKKNNIKQIFTMSSTVVHNTSHNPIGIIYLIRDITYEKQIEELREGFLRTVSHELRTPLTSVIGFIELVSQTSSDVLDDEQQSCLKTALNEARSLKTLINDLLELSQMQANKTTLNLKSVNIFSFIDDIKNSLSPLTKGKELKLINDIKHKQLTIDADETKLRRILVNLISNGIKFTHSGYIKISCIELDEHIEFCVSDTGIGLKPNEKDVIFEKFRQIDFSSTREYEGIGLGLSIVKELVDAHNGKTRVESVFGKGTHFYFTIEKKMSLTAPLLT